MNRIYHVDFIRILQSAGCPGGIILCTLAAVFGMGEMWENIAGSVMPEGEIRFLSAACISLSMEVITYIIPVACTLAASGMFVEDMQSRVIYYSILRTGKKHYLASKVFSCVIFGFMTIFSTVLLLLLVFVIMFPPGREEIQFFQMDSLIYLLKRVWFLSLNAMLYALLGGVTAAASDNRHMAYAAPFILYYVISTLFQAYLPDYPLLNPKEWMLQRFSSGLRVTVVLIAANVLAAAGYLFIMERRWKHE